MVKLRHWTCSWKRLVSQPVQFKCVALEICSAFSSARKRGGAVMWGAEQSRALRVLSWLVASVNLNYVVIGDMSKFRFRFKNISMYIYIYYIVILPRPNTYIHTHVHVCICVYLHILQRLIFFLLFCKIRCDTRQNRLGCQNTENTSTHLYVDVVSYSLLKAW